jgi:hypothetical protein
VARERQQSKIWSSLFCLAQTAAVKRSEISCAAPVAKLHDIAVQNVKKAIGPTYANKYFRDFREKDAIDEVGFSLLCSIKIHVAKRPKSAKRIRHRLVLRSRLTATQDSRLILIFVTLRASATNAPPKSTSTIFCY